MDGVVSSGGRFYRPPPRPFLAELSHFLHDAITGEFQRPATAFSVDALSTAKSTFNSMTDNFG